MNNEQSGLVRILSGINSINFFAGYDPKTKVFDKRKTEMGDTGAIYCFTDANGTRPDLNDSVTQAMLDYTKWHGRLPRGQRFIMSGIVSKSTLAVGNFSYATGPLLNVDKLFRYKRGLWRPERILDVSEWL